MAKEDFISRNKSLVWTSRRVDEWMQRHLGGEKQKDNPWLDGNKIGVRKPNLVFEYTKEEIEELKKCAKDVVYFANTYGYCLQGSAGYQRIKLRPYQEKMLRSYQDNRMTIVCSSRQIGKCLLDGDLVLLKNDHNFHKSITDLYYEHNNNLLSKVKRFLFKSYRKNKTWEGLKHATLKIIQLIEKFEYRNLELNEDDDTKKILDTINLTNEDIYIKSEDGYHKVSSVHKTQPYHVYTLILENGYSLECADNHIVFCKNFVQKFVKDLSIDDYVMTDVGDVRVKSITCSSDKLSMYDLTVETQSFNRKELIPIQSNPLSEHAYYSNGILSHNTVTAAIFLIWFTLFNVDKTVGLLSNKFQSCREIADKIKEIMNYLPFFMKPGVIKNNQTDMVFDNGCRFVAQATTPRSFIGYTLAVAYFDEFAHVDANILDQFYENAMPTISADPNAKIIITSTPNGYNKFYDLWEAATEGRNSYNPIRVDWDEVPGRDDAWRERMVADVGGEEEFMRQYGNSFLSTGNTLLSSDGLSKLHRRRTKYVYKEIGALDMNWEDDWKKLIWHPDFNIIETKNKENHFVISMDLAEGGGGDYSILNIFQVKCKTIEQAKMVTSNRDADLLSLNQIGIFRSNTTPLDIVAKLLYILTMFVFDPEHVKVVIEINYYGGEMLRLLSTIFGDKNDFDQSVILRFKHNLDAKVSKYGLKVTPANKPILCMNLKQRINDDSIILNEETTINELDGFTKIGSSYKAARGNDDLAMSCVDVTSVYDNSEFEYMFSDLIELKENEELRKYKENLNDKEYSPVYDFYGTGDSNKSKQSIDNQPMSIDDIQRQINDAFQRQLNSDKHSLYN